MRNSRLCLAYALPLYLFLVAGVPSLAQEQTFSAQFRQEKLENVLDYFSRTYDVLFAYSPSSVSDIYVSCEFEKLSLTEAMNQILSPVGFTYKVQQQDRILLIPNRGVVTSIKDRSPPEDIYITGTVRDSRLGIPLAYANIRVVGTKKGTISDQNGQFKLQSQTADSLKILCSYLGYRPLAFTVSATSLTKGLIISLEPTSTEIDEVLITEGSLQTVKVSDGAGNIMINPRESHLISGFGEADILRTIQLLPGINSTENQGGLHIRGSTPDQNLVLIDGITAYGIDHFFGMFSAVNDQAIENVNVNRGGFGAKYGGRLSGIIDIDAKRAKVDSISLYTHLSLLNSNVSLELPLIKNKVSILLAGRKSFPLLSQNPLYQTLTSNFSSSSQSQISQNDPFRQYRTILPEFDFSDANIKLSIRPSINDLIEASYFTSTDNLHYLVRDNDDIPFSERITTQEFIKVKNEGYSFSWSHQWSDKFYSRQNVAFSNYSNDYENRILVANDSSQYSGDILQENAISDMTIRSDYMYSLNATDKLSFGLHYKSMSTLNRQELYYESVPRVSDVSANSLAGYLQYDFALSDEFIISSGLRVVNYLPFKANYFEPRVSATYRMSPNFSTKIAWGRYNQFINQVTLGNSLGLAENQWVLSDDSTVPVASAEHIIVGAAYEAQGFLVDVELYQKNLYGLLTNEYDASLYEVGVTGNGGILDGGMGTSRGIDVMLQKKARVYEGWISYSYNEIHHTFEELNGGNPFPAAHENRHQIKVVNSLHLGNWSFGGTFVLATGNPYTDAIGPIKEVDENGLVEFYIEPGQINARRLPTYHRLDLSAVYSFRIGQQGKGKVGISMYNLYNRQNIRARRFQLFPEIDSNGNVDSSRAPGFVSSDILHQGFIPNFFIQASF
ncbi:MAG: TonB-dependent receptor [Bacteroidota bacterium]